MVVNGHLLFVSAVRIRSRLKKLMAKRPQLETLKKSGIMEGEQRLGLQFSGNLFEG